MSSKPSDSSNRKVMEDLFGQTLLTKSGNKPTHKVLQNADIVGLYFSASWCPPCQRMTPVLADFYNKANDVKSKTSPRFEVVFISSDHTMPSFEEYYGKMPWVAIPANNTAEIKNNLSKMFKVSGIPYLALIDAKTGEFITDAASGPIFHVHGQITSSEGDDGNGTNPAADLVKKWKEMETVPIEKAWLHSFSFEGAGGIKGLLLSALKNPMYILGFLYFVRFLMRKYKAMTLKDGAGDDGDEL